MQIEIRKVNNEDVEKVQVLNDQIFFKNKEYDSDLDHNWAMGPNGTEYFRKTFENKDALFLVAEIDGVIAGYLSAAPRKIAHRRSKYIELENMGVLPEYRLSGLGTRLINYLEKWAKENSYDKLILEAYSSNSEALSFYERNGFNPINVVLEKNL